MRMDVAKIVRKVLDISHHNDVTSWSQIVGAGIVGIIHKATEGTSYVDDQYAKRRGGALAAGLVWGAYHFANGSNVQAQVDHFLEVVGIDDATLYALDWEDDPNGNTMSADQAKQFLELIGQRIGQGRCVVYSGNTAKQKLGNRQDPFFGLHRLWLAQYSSSNIKVQASWDDCWLWQYSDGNVGPSPHGCPGVSGDVDTNSYTEGDEELRSTWSGAGAQPVPPEPPPTPTPEPDAITRPTIEEGDYGSLVRVLQDALEIAPVDGDFGNQTATAVEAFQRKQLLDADGVVGPATWARLDAEFDLPPYPTPFLAPLDAETVQQIEDAAASSDAASFLWGDDRGEAPLGYIQGIALAYATCVRKYEAGDLNAAEMAKADTGNTEKDALAWFRPEFQKLGMDNSKPGRRTLRHVFVLLLGLGIRESSGEYCCGRDTSAGSSSQTSDTCEAGLFQTSYNYHVCATDADELLDQYLPGLGDGPSPPQCQLRAFQREVQCGSTDWENIGSGRGHDFQALSKECPAFAVESAAVGVRNVRQHWGPINRKELELTQEANDLFTTVDDILSETAVVS
jgi:GH25 family lysozyme M1 (1,4-beta-N-acetylmuramidase)